MNQLNEEIKKEAKKEEPKKSTAGAQMAKVADFDFFLTRDNVQGMFPTILFAASLAIFYIANAHFTEKTIRQSDRMAKEIKELRSEYITIKSDLMFNSKQSEVLKRLAPETGIKVLTYPPKKIIKPQQDEY
jgi:redox-regulated HSP33 family molecular chaperone